MSIAIKIENLSKQYRLGLVSTRTLSHDLNRWWQTSILGREDPYLKIGETNIREAKGDSEYVWSLKDINLVIEEGEVLGIIGKNGAGKSTLLKILSKVTSPTTGTIKARGRIASLLEVGTGFHSEMTGRENIYLNGAILGMTKAEINKKLDEIIDFAGIERYIDTPVKRYSSGMLVRLGFAVAAHLDPEILVVDEVLAVGDAEFQKKAIGKMQEISKGKGRTVLFVSHNMNSIKMLCKNSIVLQSGQLDYLGDVEKAIKHYLGGSILAINKIKDGINWQSPEIYIHEIKINDNASNYLTITSDNNELSIDIKGELYFTERIITIEIDIFDINQNRVAFFGPGMVNGELPKYKRGKFVISEKFHFPKNMAAGIYLFDINLTHPYVQYYMKATKSFNLEYTGFPLVSGQNDYGRRGYVIISS